MNLLLYIIISFLFFILFLIPILIFHKRKVKCKFCGIKENIYEMNKIK